MKSHTDQFINIIDPISYPESSTIPDCSSRYRHIHTATRMAINKKLTFPQREQLLMFYQKGMTKSQIARIRGTSCSSVCKSLRSAEQAVRSFVDLYLEIYDHLCREESI